MDAGLWQSAHAEHAALQCSRFQPCITCRQQALGLRLLAAAAVAALTEKIKAMAEHMQVHRKDFSSRR